MEPTKLPSLFLEPSVQMTIAFVKKTAEVILELNLNLITREILDSLDKS